VIEFDIFGLKKHGGVSANIRSLALRTQHHRIVIDEKKEHGFAFVQKVTITNSGVGGLWVFPNFQRTTR